MGTGMVGGFDWKFPFADFSERMCLLIDQLHSVSYQFVTAAQIHMRKRKSLRWWFDRWLSEWLE